jgi:protein-export membrane protein, SecD/SecF family
MDKSLTWKIGLIIAVIALSIFLLYPPKDKINLGLDLKGGMHLVMEVVTDEALAIQTDMSATQLRGLFKDGSIPYDKIGRRGFNQIEITGTRVEDERRIKDILDDDFRDWTYTVGGNLVSLALRPNIELQLREQSVDQALETIRNRVDEFGVAEPTIQKEGLAGDRILIELPGIDNPERVKGLIKSTAMLEFHLVVGGPYLTEEAALQEYNGQLPDDLEIVRTNPRRLDKGFYVLKAATVVPGKDLKGARRAQDEYGAPAVGFSFNSQGAAQFERFTAANIGKPLSIVLDERIESVATIQDVISADGIIKGRFTMDEVDDLVLVLRSGALPAPLKYIEERTIGPSLGADSIRKGLTAALGGLLLVILFMLVYYRAAGINSVLALVLNMLILMGIMAYFRATLSLPGIAGIILSIGMAVDANVLIFERIREELAAGKSPKSAIDAGFKKAFWTIFDANLTTVISAVFLFQFGTGPIKGFAVTLIIGIAASMFTAIFVSRVIFELTYGRRRKLSRISI